MKSKIVSLGILFLMTAVVVLFSAGSASTQTERRPPEATIQVGTAGERSPTVDLKTVGREVAPGVLEVNPDSIRGKRIKVAPGESTAKHVCIGKWDGTAKSCKGIYIEW